MLGSFVFCPSLACMVHAELRVCVKIDIISIHVTRQGKYPEVVTDTEGNNCQLARDSESIRSLRTPTSLSVCMLLHNTGKVENLHGHVNCNLQYVNLDLHSL